MRKDIFSLRTVRKKIILLSKISGIVLIVSYVISTELPFSANVSCFIWMMLVIALVLVIDFLMGRFISKPVDMLNRAAHRMATLDFSAHCQVQTNDEFGELSYSLNRMSDNLQQALSELEQKVKKEHRLLVERKELVDSLSHEMKTPLGIICAYAEGLQDESDPEKQTKYTEVIISETERMSRLINTLLDLSALETGAVCLLPERFEFVEFVETVAGRLLVDSPDVNFELEYELPDLKFFVYADKSRMEQVLNNLIVNAKKNVLPCGILKLSLTINNGLLCFSIFNEGALIPEECLEKIWTKFYRGGDSTYSGSGLGLAITAQILSMHGISYGVRNTDSGVEFFFSIPTVP